MDTNPRGLSILPQATLSVAVLAHWRAAHAAGDIQAAPLPQWAPPPPPGWWLAFWRWLGEFLSPLARALGGGWPLVKWGLIGLGAVGLAALAWRIIAPLVARWRLRDRAVLAAAPDWAPARTEAEALLADADALAAAGRYDEATHLLLRRSVGQIAAAAPQAVSPAATAREIATLPQLSAPARAAFAVISARVEASRFALRPLAAADWQAARGAYADFALQRLAA